MKPGAARSVMSNRTLISNLCHRIAPPSAQMSAACGKVVTHGLPIDIRAQILTTNRAASESFDCWAVLGRSAATGQLPLPDRSFGYTNFPSQRLHRTNNFRRFVESFVRSHFCKK